MKKNLLFVLMAAFALAFTACSDDDDPMIEPSDLSTTFGADENTTLTLNYSDSPISGKQIKFDTKDSKTASITLYDVIPGKAEAVIDNITLVEGNEEYTFNGSSAITRATDYNVAYSGSVKKGELKLDLKVTVADPLNWANTYQLGEYTENAASGAIYSKLVCGDESIETTYPQLFRTLGSIILPQVLHAVTLEKDGNIRAEYYTGDIIADQEQLTLTLAYIIMLGVTPSVDEIKAYIPTGNYQKSPANLAYWFEKEGQLYVKLNIPAIIAQATNDNGTTEGNEMLTNIINSVLVDGTPSSIKALLGTTFDIDLSSISDESFATILDWAKNGIPMNVSKSEGHTYIYLDKAAFNPLFVEKNPDENDPGMDSDLMKICTLLIQSNLIPEDAQASVMLLQVIAENWPNTTEFNLGLDLK